MKPGPKDCNNVNRWLKFFRKWHRWPGVVTGFFFILWAISGIVMNHRQLFSGMDIDRDYLPKEYRYQNWNSAAVRSAVNIGADSLLVYGNIGIWMTNSRLEVFKDFNAGFPGGVDSRKISAMLYTKKGNLYAGTLFGLYYFDFPDGKWRKLDLPVKDQRIQWLEDKEDEVIVLTRSELMGSTDDPRNFKAEKLTLPPPAGYDNKAGLFRTIWVIHSGEIYGVAGKLLVDALGIIVIFLTITGMLHFSMPYVLRWLKKRRKTLSTASSTKRFSARWHKKVGIWIALLLLINTITGMFLRPPLLITIANARVGKIPWSMLDTPNPWEDKLRAVIYDEDLRGYLFGTTEGIYFTQEDLGTKMFAPAGQPPLSVMGINVFEKAGPGAYLVGSFNGLFKWYPMEGFSVNHITGERPGMIDTGSKPFGDQMVSGYLKTGESREIVFDYNLGGFSMGGRGGIAPMPPEILENSPISWWNFALEVHTGRIFQFMVGDFYILIVPLLGLFGTVLTISGLVIWIKLYVRKNR